MKIKATDKIRIAIRKALGIENVLKIEYKRKSDNSVGTYLVSANFIEQNAERFNTYSFATSANQGGIRSFVKKNVKKVTLV